MSWLFNPDGNRNRNEAPPPEEEMVSCQLRGDVG